MSYSSYQASFSQSPTTCRPAPLNMSQCSPLSQRIARAPICQNGAVWAPNGVNEYGCPEFYGPPLDQLSQTPYCSKIVPVNWSTACSTMSRYVMALGDSIPSPTLCNNQPFTMTSIVDQNGCAVVPDSNYANFKGLMPLDFQANFNYDNSVAQVTVNVPQGASAVTSFVTQSFYFDGQYYGAMASRYELRVTPSTTHRVNAIFPSTHDSPGGSIAIVAVSGLSLRSAAALSASVGGCVACSTIAIHSNSSMCFGRPIERLRTVFASTCEVSLRAQRLVHCSEFISGSACIKEIAWFYICCPPYSIHCCREFERERSCPFRFVWRFLRFQLRCCCFGSNQLLQQFLYRQPLTPVQALMLYQ